MAVPRFPVAGPCLFYVKLPDDSTPVFLGTSEARPLIAWQDIITPVYNDLGGTAPMDGQFQGDLAAVTATLNRFNGEVWSRLNQAPRYRASGSAQIPPGTTGAYEQGAVMVQDGWAFPLWLRFPYSGSPSNILQGMPPGYFFPAAWLDKPKDDEVGSQVERLTVSFYCARTWAALNATSLVSAFTLYSTASTNFTNLPAPT